MKNLTAKQLGFSLFAPLTGMKPETLESAALFKHAMDNSSEQDRAKVVGKVVAIAATVMREAGMGTTHAGIHLHKVATTPTDAWGDHHFEVADHAAAVLSEHLLEMKSADHILMKQAYTPANVTQGMRNVLEAGALVAALVGAIGGTAYFAGRRIAGNDDIKIQKKEQEIKHFERVGEKLQQRLNSAYHYTPDELHSIPAHV